MASVINQKTLRKSVTFSGIGLHSGAKVKMAFHPAAPNTGIRFRRVDLDGQPEIEAEVEHVNQTTRSTTLSKGNIKIHTVEHVLATFAGYGVDNGIIELEAGEPPIGDGSARQYCRMVREAGIEEQDAKKEVYEVGEPVQFQLGETFMAAFPHPGFKITCTSDDQQGRYTQHYSLEITPETWESELADARTFCFFEELEMLYKNGLIRGGSLENAVIIREDAVLTTEPMRFANEFVRHKILDILGDLSLLGRSIRGHVVAIKPSHAANYELTQRLEQLMRRPLVAAQSFAPPPEEPKKAVDLPKAREMESPESNESPVRDGLVLDIEEVMEILPHRYPFLMVDKVTGINGNKITAIKNVTINEPFFQGHFPHHPVMPGVLQLEAIAQVAGILTLKKAENLGKLAYFMSADNVKWRKPVRPGDRLVIEVELTRARGKINRAKGICYVDGEEVSQADVTFAMVKQ